MIYLENEYDKDAKRFLLSYQELKEQYLIFCGMDDDSFLDNLPKASHLACVIAFLKEIPAYNLVGDTGIIHELIHLMDDGTTTGLKEIRELFKMQLELA